MIARLDLAQIDDLRTALPRFAHRPLPHLHHLTPDQIQAWWFDEIKHDVADEFAIALVSIDAGIVEGLVVYTESPWDSKVLGCRIGTLTHLAAIGEETRNAGILDNLLREIIGQLADRGTECVTSKIQPNECSAIHALERHDFLLMDTLLDFVVDFSRTPLDRLDPPKKIEGLSIRPAKPADLAELVALSEKAFADYNGRYHADPKIPRHAATNIYGEWVRSSFQGWADWILVAESGSEIAGYGIWKKPSQRETKHSLDIAHYNLAAIDPKFSGRGLYTALALDGMRIARGLAQRALGPVHVSNFGVQNALQKLGWRISGARHSFHKWLTA